MSKDAPISEAKPKGRRFWLTVGEVVAVLGLGLGALNFWDGHRNREQAARQEAEQARSEAQAKAQARGRSVFVMRGAADGRGERVMLEPVNSAQVVQTQRYLFPAAVLDHGKEIGAGRLQIDLAWFDGGLKAALRDAQKAGAPAPEGEAILPVGVITTYLEDGESRTDQSIYRVGYRVEDRMLRGAKLELLGASLMRRGIPGDLQAAVETAWRAEAPKAVKTGD